MKKSFFKFLPLFLITFAFAGLLMLGTNFLSKNVILDQNSQEESVTYADATATIDKTTWDSFKETYKDDILNVTEVVTSLSVPGTIGSINESIGTNVRVDINSTLMTIYSTDGTDIYLPKNCDSFFLAGSDSNNNTFRSVTRLWITSFKTHGVTSMARVFYNMNSLVHLGMSFDTSNVTNMREMFYQCSSLSSLDLSNFDTSRVTNMERMFACCQKLSSLNLSNFNTSNVTNMREMFYYCTKLTNLDLTSFDTSNVTNMYGMFWNCLCYMLDLSNFDTAKVTDMSCMFYISMPRWSVLESLDLSSFDMRKITRASDMFGNNPKLKWLFMPKYLPEDTTLSIYLMGTFYAKGDNYTTSGNTLNDFGEFLSTSEQKQLISEKVEYSIRAYGDVSSNLGMVDHENVDYFFGQDITSSGNNLLIDGRVVATAIPIQSAEYTSVFDSWRIDSLWAEAHFTGIPNIYTITLNIGNVLYSIITQGYGTDITEPIVPSKTGYIFQWEQNIPTRMPAYDMTINGNYLLIQYKITYKLNSGKVSGSNPTTYNVETETFTLINPTKTGYTFTGWSGTDISGKSNNVQISKGQTGDRSYTAHYTINQYTLTLTDGDRVLKTITRDYGTSLNIANPKKDGYIFIGWSRQMPSTMPAENLTINAHFELETYTITYNLNGGELLAENPIGYNIFSEDFTLINPKKEGYIFSGWIENDGDEPKTEYTITQGSTGNKTLTATWIKEPENKTNTPIIIGVSAGGGVAVVGLGLGLGFGLRKKKKLV